METRLGVFSWAQRVAVRPLLWGRGCQCCPGVLPPTSSVASAAVLFTARLVCLLFVQYQEDASDIKDMSKYKPHILLSQENTQIRDLQQENRG